MLVAVAFRNHSIYFVNHVDTYPEVLTSNNFFDYYEFLLKMSSTVEDSELKGGHPPAIKVGGMRIPHHRSGHSESDKNERGKDSVEVSELNSALKVSTSPPKSVATNISGAIARGNADFPTEAVQSFHEKPLPTHNARSATTKPNIIHQPRK